MLNLQDMLLPGYKLMDKDHFCIKVAEKKRNKYKAQILAYLLQ